MISKTTKIDGLNRVKYCRDMLKTNPVLKNLFLELTMRCNEHCLHCGSYCGDRKSSELSFDQYKKILTEITEDFNVKDIMLCITGGEPLLRQDFFDIMTYAKNLGFRWGMTSNGTLITPEVAQKLYEAGMSTISISIDGLEQTHDEFRQTPGGYKKAMQGIQNLIDIGKFKHIQATTVVTHKNIDELDQLFAIFNDIDIDSWRIIGIEPIGRALSYPELLLTKEDHKRLFEFIRDKRKAGEPVVYGCSHYLGLDYEGEVREWYYFCGAGTTIASITANGDIISCLDIERRPELLQGNVLVDRFSDVWYNRFKNFRIDLSDKCSKCQSCTEKDRCHGDSFHSWNFEENRPNICFKDILF